MDAVTTCYTNGVLFQTLLVHAVILQKLSNIIWLTTARLPSFKGGLKSYIKPALKQSTGSPISKTYIKDLYVLEIICCYNDGMGEFFTWGVSSVLRSKCFTFHFLPQIFIPYLIIVTFKKL